MKHIFTLIVLMLISVNILAQDLYETADKYFQAGDYKKALSGFEKLKNKMSKDGQDNTLNFAYALINISDCHFELKDFQASANTAIEAESVLTKLGETESEAFLKTEINIAIAYASLNDVTKSVEYFQKVLPVMEKLHGTQSQNYKNIVQNIANVYYGQKDYTNSAIYFEKLVEICDDSEQMKSDALVYLVGIYITSGNNEKAAKYALETKNLMKKNKLDKTEYYFMNLCNLASSYARLGNCEEFCNLAGELLPYVEKVKGRNSEEYKVYVKSTAYGYYKMGEYYKSLPYYNKSLEIIAQSDGTNSLKYADLLGQLGDVYFVIEDYPKCIANCKKAEAIYVSNNAVKTSGYTVCINTLCDAYTRMGNITEAATYRDKSANLFSSLDENSLEYAISISALGVKYSNVANFDKALELQMKAAQIFKKLKGENNNTQYARSLINIAQIFFQRKNGERARDFLKRAVDAAPDDDFIKAKVVFINAQINITEGKYQDIIDNSENMLKAWENISGKMSQEYVNILSTVAMAYTSSKQYSKATSILKKAYDISKEVNSVPESHAYILSQIGINYFEDQDYKNAFKYYSESIKIYYNELINKFSHMTSVEKEQYWNFFKSCFDNLLVLAIKLPDNLQAQQAAYNVQLISKGMLLSSELQLQKIIYKSNDEKLVEKYNKLKDIRQEISIIAQTPGGYSKVDSLNLCAENLESELISSSAQYGDVVNYIKVNWQDVRNKLKPNDVAIEFFYVSKVFGAFVLKKDFAAPKFVALRDADYENPYETLEMYHNIWQPLEQYISKEGTVYFSPSGKLHTLAIEYAPIDSTQLMSDVYHMCRLSSTRKLALRTMQYVSESVAIFGGVNYDTDINEMSNQSEKARESMSADSRTVTAFRSSSLSQLRNNLNALYLPGTLKEANNIKAFFDSAQYYVEFYSGSEANEENFKNLPDRNFGKIHIATHGFYLDDSEIHGENALLFSGLLMSGCNNSAKAPQDVEDGILTAREISFLDLRHTDLVVMSACETGLGEVSSDGVFGLQRGFKKAGVNTLVMSLWPVNDYATQVLMTQFYKNLSTGMSKHDSFIKAQQHLRKKKGVTPVHWAAFIMLDGD